MEEMIEDFINKLTRLEEKHQEVVDESLKYIKEAVSTYEPILHVDCDLANIKECVNVKDIGFDNGFEGAITSVYKGYHDILIDVVDISDGTLHECIPFHFIHRSQYINIVKFIHRCLIQKQT